MPDCSRKKVLVVDDERGIQSLLVMVLEREGYEVRAASNGREALRVVEGANPDIILLDINMPVMDGVEFARRLRARLAALMPIIVITASSDAASKADEIGAIDWLGKPFNLEEMLKLVARYTGQALCA